ncbi:hypothetical protein C8Q76DRAFT_797221 [Earliella scabrosa]|nr:hypothetical protein C8Q76DRAFT_797221 [Earliella scabrosa]
MRHCKLTWSLHVQAHAESRPARHHRRVTRSRAVHTVVHVPDAQAQAESTTARRLLSYQQQLATASSCGREKCTPRCTAQTLTSSRGEQNSTPDLQQDLAAGPQRLPDCSRASPVHAKPHITSSRGEHNSAQAPRCATASSPGRCTYKLTRRAGQLDTTAESPGREQCTPWCTSQTHKLKRRARQLAGFSAINSSSPPRARADARSAHRGARPRPSRAHAESRTARRTSSKTSRLDLNGSLTALVRARCTRSRTSQIRSESETARRLLDTPPQAHQVAAHPRTDASSAHCGAHARRTSSRGEQNSAPDLHQDLAAGPQCLPDCSRAEVPATRSARQRAGSSIPLRKLTWPLLVFV